MIKYFKLFILTIVGLIGILLIVYLLGPKPEFELVNTNAVSLNFALEEIEEYISISNNAEPTLKPDNGSQLYWADSIGVKTDYVLLFLHGFSGTHHEANPLHKTFGERYGMNTYLHRIEDHGISDPEAFKDITPQDLLNSAKEGLTVAKKLGEKVIIMSCSTGGTYAAYLAHADKDISHLIFLSPNIALHSSSAELITGPWGETIVQQIFGEYRIIHQPPAAAPYWQTKYHTDGIIALQALIDQTMTEDVFKSIDQPTYIGCYYKDEEHQDFVVSVPAMREFYNAISTPTSDKEFIEFPDVNDHVIGSPIKSENAEAVINSVLAFGDRFFELKN